ncbi:cryptochrome-1 [Patella vulgata]|uniref:cryptochrome-1 n=1 Tax=Patella vulgata TaxID=6465 RepID=UPI0024A7A73B|nr:cryptochrome-1 [Patella vulgata]
MTFKRFQSILRELDPPNKPLDTITEKLVSKSKTPISNDHDEKYGVPNLELLGFNCENLSKTSFKGGETEALKRLHRHLERKAWVASFERPKMCPQSLMPSQTTISPYLRFGCLSARLFYWQLQELFKRVKRGVEPPIAMHGQLLWREFFYTAATNNPKFDQMNGNPMCIQIPWDKNPKAVAKWAEGLTGFPWIDAIMVQLKKEGWIHHLARHAVACFLTRGDLWLSWEEGMKVFDELLLDADWSINAGLWMWLSSSSFFAQFFQCYCPVSFGKRVDPSGDFIRQYLPVLKAFPQEYIYEPWMAPETVQKSAKCIIGKDYPLPMVNHKKVSYINSERLRQVYHHLTTRASVSFHNQKNVRQFFFSRTLKPILSSSNS